MNRERKFTMHVNSGHFMLEIQVEHIEEGNFAGWWKATSPVTKTIEWAREPEDAALAVANWVIKDKRYEFTEHHLFVGQFPYHHVIGPQNA